MKRKISFGTWCFQFTPYDKNPVGLDDVLKKAAEIGYDGISLDGNHADPESHPTLESRKALAKKIADYGLEVSEYNPKIGVVGGIIIQFQPDTWVQTIEENLRFLNDCGFTKTLRVDTRATPTFMVDSDYQRAWDITVDAFKRVSQSAAEYDMQIVWEFEPGFLFNTPSEVVKLWEDVGEPNFRLELDSSRVYQMSELGALQHTKKETLPGGQLEFIEMCKDKIGLVHLIDNDGSLYAGITSMHNAFGTGDIDFDKIVPALRDNANYVGEWWVIDLVFNEDAWNILQDAKDFVDVLNDKYGNY
ncbi:MAG: sugar phosphate isomerase/epimerase [Pseudomonadota bacterium]